MAGIGSACLALVLVAGALAGDTGRASATETFDAGMTAFGSTFSAKPGTPSGSYACRTVSVAHTDQTMVLGTMVVTPGHYSGSGYRWPVGTWSGSGEHLRFSRQPFNTALAQYGVNRAGRSSMRFVWNPKSQPNVWICTR
jgi:hypothetical protein